VHSVSVLSRSMLHAFLLLIHLHSEDYGRACARPHGQLVP
jgi:hypothetical protein